jgi:hypothetical protein
MRERSPRSRERRPEQHDSGSVEPEEIVIDYQALAEALLLKEPRLRAFRHFSRGPIDPRLLPEPN